MRGRRRGPPRRAPKDIFSPGAKKEQKKPTPQPPPKAQPIAPPIAMPPPKVAISEKKKKFEEKVVKTNEKTVDSAEISTKKVEQVVIEDVEEKLSKDIITDQILGEKPKKSRGLKEIKKKESNNTKNLNVQSDRAAALIEQSRKRAMQPVAKESVAAKKTIKPAPTRRRRNTKTSYQPAARAKRLNRSRHMEYKYEMRKLLVDIDVPEEHRSNLLGTIWAKGERKTIVDAKDFLSEKMSEGAIDEAQKSRLEKVIDDYTIRR